MLGGLKSIWETLTNLPQLIVDGIKDIFIPDVEYIQSSFNSFIAELKMKFGFDTDFFDGLFDSERPVTDIFVDYTIPSVGDFRLKVFDTKYLYDGVSYFRPFIRGFIVLLMGLYNVRMALSFIRQDAGVVAGKAVSMEMNARKEKK